MDYEVLFYIITPIVMGIVMWWKIATNKDQYMSQEWLDSCK